VNGVHGEPLQSWKFKGVGIVLYFDMRR
jgi:hypothetical protein